MDYIVILAGSRCITVALDEKRLNQIDRLEAADPYFDIQDYVQDMLSEEFDFSPNEVNWMRIEETEFHCVGKIPKFRKI